MLNLFGIYYISPAIAGICACLAFVMIKCSKGEENYTILHLLLVFLISFVISCSILIFVYTIEMYKLLDTLALPLLLNIRFYVTPEGFIVFCSDNSAPTGGSTSEAAALVENQSALTIHTQLQGRGNNLMHIINLLVTLKTDNQLTVLLNSVNYIEVYLPRGRVFTQDEVTTIN